MTLHGFMQQTKDNSNNNNHSESESIDDNTNTNYYFTEESMMLSLVGTGPAPDTTSTTAMGAAVRDTISILETDHGEDGRITLHGRTTMSTATPTTAATMTMKTSQQQQPLCGCGPTPTNIPLPQPSLEWYIVKRRDEVDDTGNSSTTSNSHNPHPDSAVYGVFYGTNEQDRLGSGQDNGNGVLIVPLSPQEGTESGFRIAVASRRNNNSHGKAAGSVTVYDYDTLTETYQQVGDVLYGQHDGEFFGFSMSMTMSTSTGTTSNQPYEEAYIAIGAIRYFGDKGSYQGVARIYRLDGTTYPKQWKQLGNELYGEDLLDHFGHSIALSQNGNIVAVGAIQHYFEMSNTGGSLAGYVKVYRRIRIATGTDTATNNDPDHHPLYHWELLGQTIRGDQDGDKFGNCVVMSASGNLMAVSAPDANNRNGYVKVFAFDGVDWYQLGHTLTSTTTTSRGSSSATTTTTESSEGGSLFGASLSMSANGMILAIGAPRTGSLGGAVTVVSWNPNTQQWQLLGGEPILGEHDLDQFGGSVSLSGDGRRIAIGATHAGQQHLTESGQVKVYDYINHKWQQVGSTLTLDQPAGNLGSAVSLAGNQLVASAPFASSPTARNAAGVIQIWELR